MLIRGRLLRADRAPGPAAPPRLPPAIPGWVRTEGGRIADVGEGAPPRESGPDSLPPITSGVRLITPAFIDAHLHIPQFGSVGCDGTSLLPWLERVVFPAETFFGAGAWPAITRGAIRSLIREGTLGFAGYLSSHPEASLGAAELIAASGLRAIVGRVAMDRNAPDDLLAADRWRAAQRPTPSPLLPTPAHPGRLSVSANPRFAIGCSEELLAETGWLRGERTDLFIQTHLAESREERERTASLFPGDRNATALFDRLGLLGPRSLLGHCCHLTADEWPILAARGAIAVHCPTANVFLESGLFDLASAREHGVRVALGSDIAAGADAAMPRVARAMIECAKTRRMLGLPAAVPTPAEAWHAITRVNAEALGWSDAGALERDAAADLLVLRVPETWLDEHLFGRLLYGWSSDLIEARILGGALVGADTIPS